ncbi:MAG TPA: amylo-alpha-1,6-glucosidase [Acidimicrobiales bacterium]|nr:amylo-alpha-1,6-glucosidase [Acidimicrobiales bacterium]
MVIEFGREVCGSLDEAAAREWLVTDGLGGYAMGTVAGLRTRRYHGLLMVAGAAANGHGDAGVSRRMLGLAALDATLIVGDARIRLATDEWANGIVDPVGHRDLESFALESGIPRWRWVIGDIVVERELAMVHGRPCVAVRHRLVRASQPVRMEITPLCTWRDGHGDRHAGADPSVEETADGFVFEHAYRVRGPEWRPGGSWYRGVRARAEAERGLADTEDLWAAGVFVATLAPGEFADVVAWAGDLELAPPPAADIVSSARSRAARIEATARVSDDIDGLLARAADQFVVSTATGPSVVAGYPWFGEWSRDTMTSYEGLFLSTGRQEEGRDLLLRSAATLSEGMLANTADAGGLEYNTADGTLWFIHAVGRHVAVTGDVDILAKLNGALDGVIDAHSHGTRFGIKVDPSDGLLQQGAPGWALTWMDARVDGQPVTQRSGKAVEINALWINALGTITDLNRRLGRHAGRWQSLYEFARESFVRRFARGDHLLDIVGTTGPDDGSIRPNQLLAISLPYGPFNTTSTATSGLAEAIVRRCRAELFTSLGLRSLSPHDPAYIGQHRGGPAERDRAYHQGTVWPWLIGPFTDASTATGDATPSIDGLVAHLGEWGLGSVSETADGDAPYGATGCPFQAWSVAELLRARRALRR